MKDVVINGRYFLITKDHDQTVTIPYFVMTNTVAKIIQERQSTNVRYKLMFK